MRLPLLNPKFSYRMILFIVSLAMFMEAVDTTVVNTAIPAMALSLKVNPIDLKIALISYLLSLAVFIPISGWIADRFGIKRVFMTALFIFTISSFFCGFAKSVPELVTARIVQGLGGALMLPVGRLIIVRHYERNELIIAMSRVVMVGALGMMLGPALGGFITHYLSWEWIFWVNIPVGLLNIVLVYYWLAATKPQTVPPLDKLGFVLFGAGLAGLTFGLSAVSETTMDQSVAFFIIVISVLLLIVYTIHSRRKPFPIVNTALLHFRTFRVSIVGNLFARLGFGGLPFLIPLLLQIGFGYTPQLSGLLLAPTAIGVMFVKPLSLMMLRFFGYKKLLILNTLLISISLWAFSLLTIHTPIYMIGCLTFIFGFFSAIQYTGMNTIAYSEITTAHFSSATSIMSTIQQISQSFGVAVCAIFIQFFSTNFTNTISVSTSTIHSTFLAMGVVTLISVLIFIQLKPEDGQEMIKLNKVEV